MLRSYLKIALRNLLKSKISSFINITGLAVGMAVAMLIGLWVWSELTFDTHFANYARIAQVLQNGTYSNEVGTQSEIPPPLGPELRNTYGADFKYVVMATDIRPQALTFEDKKFTQNGASFGAEITEMLSLDMLQGSRKGLKEPNSILLSETLAKTYFGDADPLGKIMQISEQNYKVTGVYADLPRNSSFNDLAFITPWNENEPYIKNYLDNWGYNSFNAYVQLAEGADMAQVSAKIKDIKYKKVNEEGKKYKPEMFLHPMSQWHLYSEFEGGKSVGGHITAVWLFGIIGAFVLLLACINFMNLSTARSEKRAKEVGVRKAIGSRKNQLIGQFLSESLVVACFAFVLALLLAQLSLPFFNAVADKKMSLLWSNPVFWLLGLGFALGTGLLAGTYPAFYLSSFQPIRVLKGTFKAGRLASIPRKVLVVIQFTVSIALIVGVLIVFQQIQFAKNRPIGYDTSGLIVLPTPTTVVHEHFDAIRNDLKNSGVILEMAESYSPMTELNLALDGFDWKGKDPNMQVSIGTELVSHDFGKTVDWEISAGRDFSRDFASDSTGIILSETAVKYMGLKNPLGEVIKSQNFSPEPIFFRVIGVVKDVLMESPYEDVRPMFYTLNRWRGNFAVLKLNPALSAQVALAKIAPVFQKHNPSAPFDYQFVDAEYGKKFAAELRIGRLAGFFAILAVFISCLGLFGLASFMAEQRTKEIGIRKVLGASLGNLWGLLSREFVGLVLLSCVLAAPIAYYYLHGWLQQYEYRTEISGWVFAAAAIGALGITLLTVSYQALKAALLNPVRSLKSE